MIYQIKTIELLLFKTSEGISGLNLIRFTLISNLGMVLFSIISVTILKGRKMIMIEILIFITFILNIMNFILTSLLENQGMYRSTVFWIAFVEGGISLTNYTFIILGSALDIAKIEMLAIKRNITGFILCFFYLLSLSTGSFFIEPFIVFCPDKGLTCLQMCFVASIIL